MSVSWLVQSNIARTSSTVEAIRDACVEQQLPLHEIDVIPFSTEMPEMPEIEGRFILYGYTTLLLNAFKDPKWRKGVFFDPERFKPSQYQKFYRDDYLNHDTKIMQIRDFALECLDNFEPDREFFIKPNDDLKQFTGGIMTAKAFYDWYDVFKDIHDGNVKPSTEIAIATPKHIEMEFRVVIVDGKCIACCQYLPKPHPWAHPTIMAFAERQAARYAPASVFVMDIATHNWGHMAVIECNCFNGSGFYVMDVDEIVRYVTNFVENDWDDNWL